MVVTLSKDEFVSSRQWHSADMDVIPPQVSALGNLGNLRRKKFALFCSVKCPGNIILQTYDCMKTLRDAGVTVIGGFHSPMEKECLNILRIKPEFKKPLEEGRLLFLSPFSTKENRVSIQRADIRNHFVATLADSIFMAYASPGGNLEELYRNISSRQKPLLVLESEYNRHLYGTGAHPVKPDTIVKLSITS
jgi:hypothetical protein